MTSPHLDSFESALLTELRRHVADQPLPADVPALVPVPSRSRHRVRRLAVGAVAAGLAASVVGVVGVGGFGGGSPAYAVELAGDGDVVVTVHRLDDAAGLEAALKDKGIDANVRYDVDGTDSFSVGSDGLTLGSGPTSQPTSEESRVSTSGSGAPTDDMCGFDAEPASLTNRGDDWVLRIPGDSPLMDRQVEIGTDAQGALAVLYAGNEPGTFCGVAQTAS